MHRVELTYALRAAGEARRELHHPLIALLGAIHHQGSISAAARHLGLSYRHVWGELKRWERELGHTLVLWTKGQPARLAPFGSKLLWAERRAQARLAPQFDAIRAELERAFGVAFDDGAEVIEVAASHDEGLRSLSTWAATHWKLHLDIRFSGSVDALSALNEGRAIVAGFHALKHARARSITARAYRPMLRPGHHKLIGFATRQQGLMVASGNPLAITGLRDLARGGVRAVNREPGTGTRLVLEELLADAGVDLRAIDGQEHVEPSHRAVAEAVASGRADAAFGIEAAARARGLDFLPLAEEHYYLATLADHLERSPLLALRASLASPQWQMALSVLPGYAPHRSGEVLSLTETLPWWHWKTQKR